ncbi:MAG: hypothetical protein NUV88_03675 [Candidatus Kaiserbacteria bacterium]|nr:hypothetical protein [Candidatus Kaiserbacteria bacterium]
MGELDSRKGPDTFPIVKVTEISTEHAKAPRQDLDLGVRFEVDRQLERQVSDALGQLQSAAKKSYKLEWEGNKIPRGAIVDGKTIAWTQNGQVVDDQGNMIGTYDRTIEFGGDSGKQQEMLVHLF